YAVSGANGLLNDLWKYNPVTNEWTWMHGADSTNRLGIYGTQGLAAGLNRPGARTQGATWVDAAGNLWLFGGAGYHETAGSGSIRLNDLWKYNPSTNQWTWVHGNKTGDGKSTYGTPGVEAAGNIPGGRNLMTAWVDATGNFWMFGGVGFDATANGYLNEIWKY